MSPQPNPKEVAKHVLTPDRVLQFDPENYISEVEVILAPLRTERGVSFQPLRKLEGDPYQAQIIDLFPEHEAVEVFAMRQLEHQSSRTPSEIDSIAQYIAHVSRASAILEAQRPDFIRLGKLSDEQRAAVIEAAVASGGREPNWHFDISQF